MKPITSAGCLIIGDEVLNGKIHDTNSFKFAKFCFDELSIPLKKTIVCSDDKQDIANCIKILNKECDMIVTSGGIGPTHDDVTYEALADAYDVPCELDKEVVERMSKLRGDYLKTLSLPQLEAFHKMATLPECKNSSLCIEKVFVDDSLWVPVIGIDEKVYVLPGVPKLFDRLLKGLGKHIMPRVVGTGLTRYFVKTSTKESELAPFLTALQKKCDENFDKSVKLGSYPHMEWNVNTVSIIGNSKIKSSELRAIVEEILAKVGGDAIEITPQDESKLISEGPLPK